MNAPSSRPPAVLPMAPWAMALTLWATAVALFVGGALSAVAVGLASELSPWRLAFWFVASGGTVAALMTVDTVRRVRPLYASVTRGAPPSHAALRDLWLAPRRSALACCIAAVLAVAVAVANEPGVPVAMVSFLVSAAFGALGALVLFWEARLCAWLTPFSAADMAGSARDPLPRRLAFRFAWPVGFAALLSGSVLTVFAAPTSVVAAGVVWLIAALAVVAGAIWGRRVGRALQSDVAVMRDVLKRRLELPPSTQDRATSLVPPDAYTDETVRSLADAVNALGVRTEERVDAEDEARRTVQQLQSEKMLFMASMSHDLRSPLNSILGFSELLSSEVGGKLSTAQRDNVHRIAHAGEDLMHVLNEVLDSARLEAGRLRLHKEWTPSVEILTEALHKGRELLDRPESRQLAIDAELQPGLPPVYVDKDRIVQAVVGIFRHAARAMRHGTIRLHASVSGDNHVRVVIRDSSAGLRDEDRERIFQAFRDIAEPSGRRIGGLGLGLSLARSLVTAHGGEIYCESREHEGTTFTVALPVDGPAV